MLHDRVVSYSRLNELVHRFAALLMGSMQMLVLSGAAHEQGLSDGSGGGVTSARWVKWLAVGEASVCAQHGAWRACVASEHKAQTPLPRELTRGFRRVRIRSELVLLHERDRLRT